MNNAAVLFTEKTYKYALKPLLFHADAELVHDQMTGFGEFLGDSSFARNMLSKAFGTSDKRLAQDIAGIHFSNPLGLAAGFDYEAKLTGITSSLGFGFQTVGTITSKAYDGNPKPRLGRLPHSQSLLVNKGFKNKGAKATIKKLTGKTFSIPIGISIGRTNSASLTQSQSVDDILASFIAFESSTVHHTYYELNISCPNLYGDVTFYTKNNLMHLLQEISSLKITRPIFIKMQIEKNK